MRFKKIKLALALFSAISLSSCSIFGSDEGTMIESISATSGEDGSTTLTFTFTDPDIEPLEVNIPKGEQGEQGAIGLTGLGIDHIDCELSEDGKNTILTIYFTSEEVEPKVVTVPNGVGIDTSVPPTYTLNPDNNTTVVTYTLTNGETITFEVSNGKDGIGIQNVTSEQLEDGSWVITITYTDPSMGEEGKTVITLPYKNGEDGRGINALVGLESEGAYTITVFYSDNTVQTLDPITLPVVNKWVRGNGYPDREELSTLNAGDYYFDTENYIIYYFDGTDLLEIINLTEDNAPTKTYTVTFDANGGVFTTAGVFGSIKVNSGETIAISRIPICSMEGFSFEGYYTTPEGPDNPLSGKLTDLTPIYRDITFYAHYEKI